MPNPLSIIIPAAGMGRRMKSYGPKALIQLNQETVIGRQLRLLKQAFPGGSTVVVTGFESEQVRRALPKNVRVVVNHDYEYSNVSQSILLGLAECPPGPVLVVYGDLVFDLATIACMHTPGLESAVLVDPRLGTRCDEVGLTICDGMVANFSFGLPDKWGHVLLLDQKEQQLFVDIANQAHRKKQYAFEILNEVIDRGGSFLAVRPARIRLAEIDSSKDLTEAKKIRD